MGYVLCVREVRAGNVVQAPAVRVGLAGGRVSGIDHRNPVDVETIAVGTRGDGTEGHVPNAVVSLLHRHSPLCARGVATDELDRLGFRGMDAERDLLLGRNLGRNVFGRPWAERDLSLH